MLERRYGDLRIGNSRNPGISREQDDSSPKRVVSSRSNQGRLALLQLEILWDVTGRDLMFEGAGHTPVIGAILRTQRDTAASKRNANGEAPRENVGRAM